ncbi:PPOX class F420-dependent oxidoreductase [Micromonospora costi]|uniref:PPOX class F420-dependent oxidoreductase n=1 Tax=Micromonospora costi TaxID=1530042 RepID=UPI0034078D55
MGILTDEDLALLAEPQLAHVATIEPDGSPHVTPVWVDTDGEHILFNTVRGRVKYENLRRDPHVAISVADKADDFRTLWVKGTAELLSEGADAHIDRMAMKYLGQDTYPFRQPGEERVLVRVTPTHKLGRA